MCPLLEIAISILVLATAFALVAMGIFLLRDK